VSDINLHMFSGPEASLRTPPTCSNNYSTIADLTPWSTPEGADVHLLSAPFGIDAVPGALGCPSSPEQLPAGRAFDAGTVTPKAGAFSPFVLKLSREDGSQEIGSVETTLPQGLVGRLVGIPYCSEAAIASASGKSGRQEQASPSCPVASEVGTVVAGAGAGPKPYYAGGHAYLAGPYNGAPLSLAVISPAVAGPFDLGNVVTRVALNVDPFTALITAVSDPLPTILKGIPLDLRSISINLNRPQFTLNPTNCNTLAVTGATSSTVGQVTKLQRRFQVGGCNELGFKPNL
jgi:hypothetical protein